MSHGYTPDAYEDWSLVDDINKLGEICWFDGSHQSADDLNDYIIRLAIRYGWEECGYIGVNEVEERTWAADEALDYLNDQITETNYYLEVVDNSLLIGKRDN